MPPPSIATATFLQKGFILHLFSLGPAVVHYSNKISTSEFKECSYNFSMPDYIQNSERKTNILEPDQKLHWPRRFNVRAEVRYQPHRGARAGVMQVVAFQPEMQDEEVRALLIPLGYTSDTPGYRHLAAQARDTFSLPQAEALTAYLNRRPGTAAYLLPANLPLPVLIGASEVLSLPSFRDGSVYRLYTERGYDLPFKVVTLNMKTFIALSRLYNELRQHEEGA